MTPPTVAIPCPVCGSLHVRRHGAFRGTHAAFLGMVRMQCAECGLVFADPMPSREALHAYNESYYDSAHGGMATDARATAYHAAINRIRLAHVEAYCARVGCPPTAVLEVGPGHGHLARHIRSRHPAATYDVVETDEACRRDLAALGVTVHDSLEALAPQAGRFDLLVLSHVLEHVTDPMGFLGAAVRLLRPGGVMFIEVPCRDYLHKRHDEPHLLFFDKSSLGRLLEALGCGRLQLTWHGRTITSLTGLRGLWGRVTSRLYRGPRLGDADRPAEAAALEVVTDAAARAVVAPFEAHREHDTPAWWLRAMAVYQP